MTLRFLSLMRGFHTVLNLSFEISIIKDLLRAHNSLHVYGASLILSIACLHLEVHFSLFYRAQFFFFILHGNWVMNFSGTLWQNPHHFGSKSFTTYGPQGAKQEGGTHQGDRQGQAWRETCGQQSLKTPRGHSQTAQRASTGRWPARGSGRDRTVF